MTNAEHQTLAIMDIDDTTDLFRTNYVHKSRNRRTPPCQYFLRFRVDQPDESPCDADETHLVELRAHQTAGLTPVATAAGPLKAVCACVMPARTT